MAEKDYTQLERPYDELMRREDDLPYVLGEGSSVGGADANGAAEEQVLKEGGAMNDIWISNFIRATNWKPKSFGFYIDGRTGYAEFSDIYIVGNITATGGTIGGWTIGETTLTGGNAILGSTGVLTLGTINDVVIASAVDATYRLWIGHATAASAPFSVTKAGVLTATGATITGTIQTATSEQRIVIASSDNSLRFFDATAESITVGGAGSIAMVLTGNTTKSSGIAMTSTVAGIGFAYTNNSSVNSVGLDLANTAGGGALPSIRITKTGSGNVVDIVTGTTGKGIYLLRDVGSGVANLLHIENAASGGGSMVLFKNNGVATGTGLEVQHYVSASVVSTGIIIDTTSGNSSLCFAFRFNGSEIVTAAVGATQDKKIRVSIVGTDYYVPLYTT